MQPDNINTDDFKYFVDQFEDIRVLRYRLPGFESLTLRQKELIYYLAQAALSGRDILWDQNFRFNLLIRKTIEAILDYYSGDKTSEDYNAFLVYAKRVFFANGIHHHYSNDKFRPGFNAGYFENLIKGTDEDKLLLENSQTVDQLIVEEVYRSGGLYGKAIDQIVLWLEKAIGVSELDLQKKELGLLIDYYSTGDLRKWDDFNVAWVQNNTPEVDYNNGFIETYSDPLGMKATWEAIVNYTDLEASARTSVITSYSQWFEDNSPVQAQYKKELRFSSRRSPGRSFCPILHN
jgi:dipeptidyl-peptidase III